MIINVRGASGSGKTYAVKQALNYMDDLVGPASFNLKVDYKELFKTPVAVSCTHYDMQPVYLIGDYVTREFGGCDSIMSQDMICSLVRYCSQFGHVIFEGLMVSGLYARYVALAEELSSYGEKYVWLFLDTPLEKCIEHIMERRNGRGEVKPFNTKATEAKYRQIANCRTKLINSNFDVRELIHTEDTGRVLLDILNEDCYRFEFREESFR